MKTLLFSLLSLALLPIAFTQCAKKIYVSVYDKSTNTYKKVPREEAFPEKVMTPEEIEKENRQLTSQGYR